MPDIAVHAAFGQEVRASLPGKIQDALQEQPYTFGLFGPDLWFMHQPWKRREGRGRQMHTTRTGAFLMAVARHARTAACREDLFSWLAGFLCHYALDSIVHPYVIHVTTEQYHFPRCHMSLEHSLDVLQTRRDGFWGEKHPVTDHYFPVPSLPGSTRQETDAVFAEVYGWQNAWKALNRSARGYRRCWRLMENPKGLAARLARLTGHPLLKSLTLSESHFNTLDPENTAHRPWKHSHDDSQTSCESFPELREKARRLAVSLIQTAYGYVFEHSIAEAELARIIGNNSYLSGLPVDDPRNHRVSSLLPSGGGAGGGSGL